MINDGIYEQIVNTKLKNELDQLNLEQYDIDLEQLDADDDKKIQEKGEILRSLYQKLNRARSITEKKVVRPETSLLESTLFTGAKQEPQMLSEIKKEIVGSDSIDLLISFIKWSAIVKILNDLKEFTSRPHAQLRIITTTYMKATDLKAVMELAKLPNTQIKVNYDTTHTRIK